MADAKLSVTIVLPGSIMMTSQECDKNPKENYDRHTMVLSVAGYDKKTKKSFIKKEPLHFETRRCIPASQVIKMNAEAYRYMISAECPEWFAANGGIRKWKNLSCKERLEFHLDRTCKGMGGLSYTYKILDD